MPKRIAPLSDTQVNKAKPKEKDYMLSDGGGLFLLVTTRNSSFLRLAAIFCGLLKMMSA